MPRQQPSIRLQASVGENRNASAAGSPSKPEDYHRVNTLFTSLDKVSPVSRIDYIADILADLHQRTSCSCLSVVVSGDFNVGAINWSTDPPTLLITSPSSADAEYLLNFLDDYSLSQSVTQVSRPASGKTLDLVLSSAPSPSAPGFKPGFKPWIQTQNGFGIMSSLVDLNPWGFQHFRAVITSMSPVRIKHKS